MLDIKNLHVHFTTHQGATVEVLKGISLTIEDGESVAVMGANGSGKTTFARCLNGLLLPTQGEVLVDGLSTQDSEQLQEIRRRFGMVFQNPENQIVSVTVEREIAFGLENLAVPHDEMHAIVDEMLRKFNLESYRDHPPHLLSGGEMQRLALAAIMAMRPRTLVFDEPTSLLDSATRSLVLELVGELQQEAAAKAPMTAIFITQIPEEALHFDRLIVLSEGAVLVDDTPATAFSRVDEMQQAGVPVPVEFAMKRHLEDTSGDKSVFDVSDFHEWLRRRAP